jgi:hypothetical protein
MHDMRLARMTIPLLFVLIGILVLVGLIFNRLQRASAWLLGLTQSIGCHPQVGTPFKPMLSSIK